MPPARFRALAMMATLGLTAACAAPPWPPVATRAGPGEVLSGITTPGQAYLRELTIGAAQGMRVAGWRDRQIETRVDRVREEAELFRFDLPTAVIAKYDEARKTGYEQGLSGAWDEAALEGYLDVIEAGNARFLAIEGAGHSSYAWGTPLQAISSVTAAGAVVGPDRHGYEVAATALASEINVASRLMAEIIERTGEDRVPAVEVGERLTRGLGGPAHVLLSYAEVLPPSPEPAGFLSVPGF